MLICVSVQGGDKYQSAFYVFEELASAPGTSAPLSIVGQAIAEIHLGRLPEAEAALTAALETYPTDVELIANSIVLNVLAGKQTEDLESYVILSEKKIVNSMLTFISSSRLQQVQPAHPLLTDIQEKSEFFDTAAAKFSAKVSS